MLIALFGAGLVLGGAFVIDPWLGFPVGAAEPTERSGHAIVHDVAPVLAVNALVVACLVFTGRFGGLRQRRGQLASIARRWWWSGSAPGRGPTG